MIKQKFLINFLNDEDIALKSESIHKWFIKIYIPETSLSSIMIFPKEHFYAQILLTV